MDALKNGTLKKALLLGSLGLNVFLLGLLISSQLMHRGGYRPMEKEIKNLSEDNRQQFSATMQQTRQGQKQLYAKMREHSREMAAILAAPELDTTAFTDKARQIAALRAASSMMMYSGLLEASRPLSADERAAVAKTLEHRYKKHRKK